MDQSRIYALVSAVNLEEGTTYSPEWADVVGAAAAAGLLRVTDKNRLELTDAGRSWLAEREPPPRDYALVKISFAGHTRLKAIAAKRGKSIVETLDELIAKAE